MSSLVWSEPAIPFPDRSAVFSHPPPSDLRSPCWMTSLPVTWGFHFPWPRDLSLPWWSPVHVLPPCFPGFWSCNLSRPIRSHASKRGQSGVDGPFSMTTWPLVAMVISLFTCSHHALRPLFHPPIRRQDLGSCDLFWPIRTRASKRGQSGVDGPTLLLTCTSNARVTYLRVRGV